MSSEFSYKFKISRSLDGGLEDIPALINALNYMQLAVDSRGSGEYRKECFNVLKRVKSRLVAVRGYARSTSDSAIATSYKFDEWWNAHQEELIPDAPAGGPQ